MKQTIISVALSVFAVTSALATAPETNPNGYKLVWGDEFNYTGAPDSTKWTYEHGFVRNREPQWYQRENARVADGCLIIEARNEHAENTGYESGSTDWRRSRKDAEVTSSSVTTRGMMDFLYGSLEVCARIPARDGAWPAIWTLGLNNPWPSNGEIDILEYYEVGGEPKILANACWGSDQSGVGRWNTKRVPYSHFTERDPQWADKFHVWRMDWTPDYIRIYIDNELINDIDITETINGKSAGSGENPFHKPQYLLLNLALKDYSGKGIDPATLPMRYEIDYVRLYQHPDASANNKLHTGK